MTKKPSDKLASLFKSYRATKAAEDAEPGDARWRALRS